MTGKKKSKVVPKLKPVKMQNNPLTRRKSKSNSNKKTKSKSNNTNETKKICKNIKMSYNPVRDCGSIGGAKKKRTQKYKKQKNRKNNKKSCGCSNMWFKF